MQRVLPLRHILFDIAVCNTRHRWRLISRPSVFPVQIKASAAGVGLQMGIEHQLCVPTVGTCATN